MGLRCSLGYEFIYADFSMSSMQGQYCIPKPSGEWSCPAPHTCLVSAPAPGRIGMLILLYNESKNELQ